MRSLRLSARHPSHALPANRFRAIPASRSEARRLCSVSRRISGSSRGPLPSAARRACGIICWARARTSCSRTRGSTAWSSALAKVCIAAANEGLSGLEFAYGIPGCVGGAVYMNAGAYGGEIKDVLACATFLDETGAERTLQAGELQLGYRTSVFEREPWCILSATFTLREDDTGPIRERMADYARRRMEKQPLDMPSAGSTFKRPEGAYAGALIDQCGLRGYAIGGAQVSQKHCGFIVNTGNATCADVLCLADTVCKIVTDETGFRLEKEVRVVK